MDPSIIIRTKVNSLSSARQKLWLVKELLQEWNISSSKDKRDRILFELEIVTTNLESFKSFQVYKLVTKINQKIINLNSNSKLEKEVKTLLLNLINNAINQSKSLQLLIEQRVQSEILLKQLSSYGKKGFLDLESNEQETLHVNEETQSLPSTHNEEIVQKRREAYCDLINAKNKINSDSDKFLDIKNKINHFASHYDKSELINTDSIFNRAIFNLKHACDDFKNPVQVKDLISETHYPRYLIDSLENFMLLFFELLVDYGIDTNYSESIEFKVSEVGGHLYIEVTSSFDIINFYERLSKLSDGRVDEYMRYAKFLKIETTGNRRSKVGHALQFKIPQSLDVYSAYQVKFGKEDFFILENDINAFISLSNDNLYKTSEGWCYSYKGVSLPLVSSDGQDSFNVESCVGVLTGNGAEKKIFVFEAVLEKELIVLNYEDSHQNILKLKGICCYGNSNYYVINMDYKEEKEGQVSLPLAS